MKPHKPQNGPTSSAIHTFSFASGALALVYEILWMRRFALVFGGTVAAAAAILFAFFLGLALGSAVIGRHSARWRRPLRAFGTLQIGTGVGCLLAEVFLRLYNRGYPALYSLLADFPGAFLGAKIILATGAIFLPTFFMGGSLPVLAQALNASRGGLGVRAGGLYSVNTLGATLGALLVPFVLLTALGAEWSYVAAIAGSIFIGVAAWFCGRLQAAPGIEAQKRSIREVEYQGEGKRIARSLGVPAFFSGLLLMALEVFWTRMFALIHENSVHSFAAIVAVFLIGLAGGAALAREYLRRGGAAGPGLAAAWCGAGMLVLLSPRLFLFLSQGMDYLAASPGMSVFGIRILFIAIPVVLPTTLISGMILPLLMEFAGMEGTPAGPALGRLLSINTVGSILGPLLALGVLNSPVGLWRCIALAGVALLIGAELIRQAFSGRAWTGSRRFAAYVLLALATWLLDPRGLSRVRVNRDAGERIVAIEEGSYGTVAVLEDDSHRWMMLNNHYVLGGTASARDEGMQAHIPLLLHENPRRVAFLGLGTGITAGAVLEHRVESVVALEIVPEVIRAARLHFAEANHHVVDDPRVEIRAEDARNFLRGSRRKFDLIIGDLLVPWRPGESALFSLEHFQSTREALLPGGFFCQWLPLYQLSQEGFGIVTATFLKAYPNSLLWRGDFLAGQPAVALIGFRDQTLLGIEAIDRRVREMAATRATVDNPYLADPSGLWLFLVGRLDSQDKRYATARQNQDNRPWLELLAPIAYRPGTAQSPSVPHGRFLADLFLEMRNLPLDSSPLTQLDADHRTWWDAGAELWKASILAAEGREKESHEKALQVLASLPAPLQAALTAADEPGAAK